MTSPRAGTATSPTPLVPLDDVAQRALRAWADIDRFEMPQIDTRDGGGWRAVDELKTWVLEPGAAQHWPPVPVKSPKKAKQLGCLVMVGCVKCADVEDALVDAFHDDLRLQGSLRRSSNRKLTYRASFAVDGQGRPVADSLRYHPLVDFTALVSRTGERSDLGAVTTAGLRHVEEVERCLQEAWAALLEEDPGPIPGPFVRRVVDALQAPDVRERRVRYDSRWLEEGQSVEPPQTGFFREDLLRTALGPTSTAAATFLAGRPGAVPWSSVDVGVPEGRTDLLDPANLPPAGWPGEHRPRLSQQLAVQAILSSDDPVLAVNGPPGTGKTTLLREVYANTLADRAAVMARFDDPRSAFGAARTLPLQENRTVTFHPVDSRLTGFELIVASSNNAAVANVSQEILGLEDVREDLREDVTYFREASDAERDARQKVVRPGLRTDGAQTWGLGAATLGNRGKISAFADVVGRYLKKEAPGSHLLHLLDSARPTPRDWAAARRRFGEAVAARDAWSSALDERRTAYAEALAVVQRHHDATRHHERSRTEATEARARLAAHREREGFWVQISGLFKTFRLRRAAARADASLAEAAEHLESLQQPTAAARSVLDGVDTSEFVDDARWWGRDRDDLEKGTAWLNHRSHTLQAEVFAAALTVHEQFVLAAHEQVYANLRVWLHLRAGEVRSPDDLRSATDVWRSFFLLVPMVSTTFASMSRMFAGVGAGELGWLIVDEAGQATPAQAVGGLHRVRRAVIVGDPKQLEPVVTLPHVLVDRLMAHHEAPAELAPTAGSVQRSADSVTRYGTLRDESWLGLPLLVHNRCLEPMFTIADEMAYRRMVQGRVRPAQDAATRIGESRWIDVPHPAGDHFQEADADVVRHLLRRLDWRAAELATVAVLSPFRDVVHGVERLVRSEMKQLLPPRSSTDTDEDDVDDPGDQEDRDPCRVGTIHTFQGQQRNVVVLVLGGGSPGARQWAAGTPNLLNVAVTRAQDRLVVVGDWNAWHDVGNARYLAEHLPRVPWEREKTD